MITSEARFKQLAAINNQASQRVVDILDAYVKHDMDLYGMPGGPVHDASVIAYLIKPELFSGRRAHRRSTAVKARPLARPSLTGTRCSSVRPMCCG